MRSLKFLVVFFFIFNSTFLNAQTENLSDKITKNLRCLICQGQSVYDSDSAFANSLKILVKKKLNEGFNEKQIYDFLKNKYGEWILYEPEFNKNTYLLWLLPILMFLFGGAIIFKLFILKKNKLILFYEFKNYKFFTISFFYSSFKLRGISITR
jgi:cytochrome c-type biogenesis protein CcmH